MSVSVPILYLSLSPVNAFNVLELVLLSSNPEFTAEIVGIVVIDFIKKLVKLVINIDSENNDGVNQKALEIKTHTKDASISVIMHTSAQKRRQRMTVKKGVTEATGKYSGGSIGWGIKPQTGSSSCEWWSKRV